MNSTTTTEEFVTAVAEELASATCVHPMIERHFSSAYLWSKFDTIVTKLTNGWFVPHEFEFVPGDLPLSNNVQVFAAIATYYLVVFGGREVLKNTKPFHVPILFQIHNLLLTSASFILLVLMAEQLVPMIAKHGLYFAICNPDAWTQEMATLYYLNYLVKFWEFTDTFFLVLKHKRLTFLHTYHHGATALLCYTQLLGTTSISWVPITLNLFVHVIMYWYCFLASRGIKVWWKEWVTRFQIIQFILDIGFIYFASYQKLADEFIPSLPHCGSCVGSTTATIAGVSIISSYLVLFISFYINVYKRKDTKASRIIKRTAGGVAAKVNKFVTADIASMETPSPSPSPLSTRKR